MKKILKYFLQGLLYVVPIGVTIYILWMAFVMIDGLLPINIPGLGILIIFISITVIGVISRHLLSDQILELVESYIKRAPLINVIYTAVKDLMNAFVGDKRSFNRPVMVKLYENSEIRRMGFITNDNFRNMNDSNDLITVYIPHSYNISGNMFLVPMSYIEPVNANASDIMKYCVSGGVTRVEKPVTDKVSEQKTVL